MATKNTRYPVPGTRYLKNKRILITAGPTWVPIDNVRVISNIATGETGILLAEKLNDLGAKVTLLLGPVGTCSLHHKIRLIRFKLFNELKNIIKKELKLRKYDIVVHAAAVSDFRPEVVATGKLKSDRVYNLRLLPTSKIIRQIFLSAPKIKIIPFKLESGCSDKTLIERAKNFLSKIKGDFIVANRINPYRAFIIDRRGNTLFTVKNKQALVNKLPRVISYVLSTTY